MPQARPASDHSFRFPLTRTLAGILLTAACWLPAPAAAQEADLLAPVGASQAAYQDAVAAYRAGDDAAFLRHMTEAVRHRPRHPTLRYNLAAAHARAGDAEGALAHLRRYARMGLVAEPDADEDFASVHGHPGFAAVVDALQANAAPVGEPTRRAIDADPLFFPEGIAYDAGQDRLFIGSVRTGAILDVRGDSVRPFVAPALGDGIGSVFGLATDASRALLWAVTAPTPYGADPDGSEQAALVAFDLATGERRHRYDLAEAHPDTSLRHWPGDLALAPDGTVYVSDSQANTVYRLAPGAERLVALLPAGTFRSLQGLVLDQDESALYAADYSLGLVRINLAETSVSVLPIPDDATLLGTDGLVWAAPDTLLAVQNGVRPQRVVRVVLASGGRAVVAVEPILANHPDLGEPTLGLVRDDWFMVVANSLWPLFNGEGVLREGAAPQPPVLLGIRWRE